MTAREKIFTAIHAALDPLPSRTPRPLVPPDIADAKWLADAPETLPLFLQRTQEIGTVCFTTSEALAAWLASQAPKLLYVPPEFDDLAEALASITSITRDYQREAANTIDAALTPAAGGIAESGSIILTDATTSDRLAALAPWIHIALVRQETIHRSIADALAAMPDDPNIIWVTGPSKTADVEGILIQGVHGPGIQACLVI